MTKIVIATTTYYPKGFEDARLPLALHTIKEAVKRDHRIVVVDGGSPAEIVSQFRELGATVEAEVDHERGQLGPGRRQALSIASELAGARGCTFWTEPEKWLLIRWLKAIANRILNGPLEMVIPQRRDLDSYPGIQALAENLGNELLRDIIGIRLDTWFGPMALSQPAVRYFLDYKGEYGDRWDSIHIPRLRVMAAQLPWASEEVAYEHPEEQTREEEGDPDWGWKRLDQLQNMVPALWMEAYLLRLAKKSPPLDILNRFAH